MCFCLYSLYIDYFSVINQMKAAGLYLFSCRAVYRIVQCSVIPIFCGAVYFAVPAGGSNF